MLHQSSTTRASSEICIERPIFNHRNRVRRYSSDPVFVRSAVHIPPCATNATTAERAARRRIKYGGGDELPPGDQCNGSDQYNWSTTMHPNDQHWHNFDQSIRYYIDLGCSAEILPSDQRNHRGKSAERRRRRYGGDNRRRYAATVPRRWYGGDTAAVRRYGGTATRRRYDRDNTAATTRRQRRL